MDNNILIQTLIEQNRAYKDMLIFGMSSIITLLVIFLTANFFTMRKFREEEKEKLKLSVYAQLEKEKIPLLSQELNSTLENLVNNTFQSLEEKITNLSTELTTLEKDFSQLKQKYPTDLSDIQQNFDVKLSTLKENYSYQINTTKKDFYSKINEVKGNVYYLEAGIHFTDKVYNNAFTYYLKAGQHFIDADSLGHIGHVLKNIEKTASLLPYKSGSVITDFSKFSQKLDTEYQAQCQKIIEILLQVKNI